MKINKELVKRNVAGEVLLIPVGKTVFEYNGLMILNETGSFLWDLLPNTESEEDLVRQLLAEYEVSEDEAAADVREFIQKTRELGIID